MTAAQKSTEKAAANGSEIQDQIAKIADDARDYVSRSAASAKDRTDSAYETATEYNKGVGSALTRAVTGYVSFLDGMARFSHDNMKEMLQAVENVAAAKSLSEAAKIQADFVRESASANFKRARAAFDKAREVATEDAEAARARVAEIWKFGKKAA